MAAEEIHINDIGTIFEVTLMDNTAIVDVSSQLSMQILIQKPDKTVLTKSALFTTDGTDGKIQYVSVLGDLDIKGKYKIQGRVQLPTGKWSSDINEFTVYSNLD